MNNEESKTRLFQIKYLNEWFIFGLDLFFSTLATGIALLIVEFIAKTDLFPSQSIKVLLMAAMCSAISLFCSQSYKGVIRHLDFTESGPLIAASFGKFCLMWISIHQFLETTTVEKIFLFLISDVTFTIIMLIFLRLGMIFMYRLIQSTYSSSHNNLLIFSKDINFFNNLSLNIKEEGYNIAGFLSFGEKHSYRINSHKVYYIKDQDSFELLVMRLNIHTILFSDYSSVKEEQERMIRYCEKMKIRMLVMPAIDELKNGVLKFRDFPEVHIEDLLSRPEIQINMGQIEDFLEGKTVLVTGAAGSIGSELCRQLSIFGVRQIILFDSAETPMHTIRLELEEKFPLMDSILVIGDVRMPGSVENVFKQYNPQVVFHAAAYKHVPMMEENPCEAVVTNVCGTKIVADMAVKYRTEKFIMISTDKAVNPTNVMGASKRLAEIYIQSLSLSIGKAEQPGRTRFITTRFGNVLGSNGSVIPRFREQISQGGPVTVTHPEIVRYFMTIPEACRLVLEASFMGKGNEIFVFDMGSPVKIADLAKRMIELAGLKIGEDINIQYTGLRPGEKLYEELLANKENTIPTANRKIFCALVREYDYSQVNQSIRQVIHTARCSNKIATVQLMKEIIPEYKSEHSEYEILDEITARSGFLYESEKEREKDLLTHE